MPFAEGRHLGQMRHTEHLVARGEPQQGLADECARPPADTYVNLIQDLQARFAGVAEDGRQGQQEARRLAAAGNC